MDEIGVEPEGVETGTRQSYGPGVAFPLEEIQTAFDRYRAAAAEAGRTGNWELFVACFTDDVNYVEHHYGTFKGRAEVRDWIVPAMTVFPVDHMTSFPWNWYTIDADRGWVVGEVANVMDDPGDGQRYEAANWTRLVYAGDGLFSEEEDVYNPKEFADMMRSWLTAWRAHHTEGV
ncbi:MAG: nuclear transport factor 2 family protein [Acidobacteriota bacterium]|nr:nuclear transport factor 2 family protein [Acidobacteriota bacterium]